MAHLFPLLHLISCILFVKRDQSSRLHTEYSLDFVARLEGKKGFPKNGFNGRLIVLAKQTEHPKNVASAGIYCKHEKPRLEKVKKPEFSAREIKPEGLTSLNSTARSKVKLSSTCRVSN
ncbi:uncharacterized protein J3R85_006504 [Psidium guajava]|nr:uncharacterized protein J3R85_006504 [Psidium guajava]